MRPKHDDEATHPDTPTSLAIERREGVTPPNCTQFPVVIPPGFAPTFSDCDGPPKNAQGKQCAGYVAPYSVAWGGGFWAARNHGGTPSFHRARDIGCAEGAEFRSPTSGQVPRRYSGVGGGPGAGCSPEKSGNYVVIVGDDGWIWYGAHLRDLPLVQPGDHVQAGQLLGYVGRTGNARRKTGNGWYGCPHLHLSLTSPARLRNWIARGAKPFDHGRTYSATLLGPEGLRVAFRNEKVDPTPFLAALPGAPKRPLE